MISINFGKQKSQRKIFVSKMRLWFGPSSFRVALLLKMVHLRLTVSAEGIERRWTHRGKKDLKAATQTEWTRKALFERGIFFSPLRMCVRTLYIEKMIFCVAGVSAPAANRAQPGRIRRRSRHFLDSICVRARALIPLLVLFHARTCRKSVR